MTRSQSKSYWPDQRDIPDSKYGKTQKPADCKCTDSFTCRVCLSNPPVYFFSQP